MTLQNARVSDSTTGILVVMNIYDVHTQHLGLGLELVLEFALGLHQ